MKNIKFNSTKGIMKIKNYLKNIQNIKNSSKLSAIYIIFKGSTQNETKGNYGINHLIEHLMYKKLNLKFKDIFIKDGIEIEAWTDSDTIFFGLEGLEKKLKDYRKDFIKNFLNFDISEKNFLIEKKIVLEEYNMYFSNPKEAHYLNLLRKKFNYYDSIGLKEDINNISFEDCIKYYNTFFRKPHSIINISRNYIINEKDLKNDLNFDFQTTINQKKFYFNNNNDYILEKFNLPKKTRSVIYIGKKFIDLEDLPYIDFLNLFLNLGFDSPINKKIREKSGLVYYIDLKKEKLNDFHYFLLISTETNKKNINELNEKIFYIFNNFEKFISTKKINYIKEYLENEYEKNKIKNYKNIDDFISFKKNKINKVLKKINIEKLKNIFDKYYKDWYISIDEEEFKNI